jgi:hypothetical protein
MMTPGELRELCTALRNKQRRTDDELVDRIEADVEEYRDILAADPTSLPPAGLAERLPLMGWLIYEASWDALPRIPASFDREATPPDVRRRSEAEFALLERIAECSRGLPWPEFAPRSLGALRALALAESKRDTIEGYDTAWNLHRDSHRKYASFRDSYGSGDEARTLRLQLDEVLLQLALAETGTACRTAEQVIARWAEDFAGQDDPDMAARSQEEWIQRIFTQLTDGLTVGEQAIRTAYQIREEYGFAETVDEERLARSTALQNPGIMTARAASLLLAMGPAMHGLGRRPIGFDSWENWEEDTLRRFVLAYGAIEEDVPGRPEMDRGFQRQLVHVRLNLALLKPGYDLPSRRTDDLPCLGINPLGDEAVEAMSAWLGGPEGRGRERALGAATMPKFIRSLVDCRGLGPGDRGYQSWRIKWFTLDQYSDEPERLERVRRALAAAG